MKQLPMIKKAALAFAAAGLMASATAHADTLLLDQDVNTLLAFTVDAAGQSKSIDTGLFNVSNLTTGDAFVAFCAELLQGVSVQAVTTGLDFTSSASTSAAVKTLFDQSFSTLNLTSAAEVGGFQIALWELLEDDGDLTTGNYSNWVGKTGSAAEASALTIAWIELQAVADGDPTTGNYSLTHWASSLSQDLIQASTGGGAVPEPTTLALGALGLAGLSAVRRRKS